MAAHELRPRCTIEIIDETGKVVMVEGGDGQMVPILDEGASIEPAGSRRARYREYWTEEEDLTYTYRPLTSGSGPGTPLIGGVHGNIGYELIVREKQQRATLRVDYFGVLPTVLGGALALDYEPRSVTVTSSLEKAKKFGLSVQVEWQPGLSVNAGGPFFKWLRVRCR
jgi:hypothetical protein